MTYVQKRNVQGYLFLLPYLLSFCGFVILPIFVAFGLAFMQFDLTTPANTHFVAGQNFAEAYHDVRVWDSLKATASYTVLMVPSLVVTALAMAFGLNAMAKGRNVVRALLFIPGMLNVAVTGILWRWFYNNEFGLFNYLLKNLGLPPIPFLSEKAYAMPSIVLMSLWWTLGGASVVMLAALQQIPKMIFEAALIDGANGPRLLSRITLPLLKPVLLFVIVTNTIAGFQVFGQPFMLTNGGPELSTRGIVQYIYELAFNQYRLGYGAALSWILVGIIALFAILQFRLMRSSE